MDAATLLIPESHHITREEAAELQRASGAERALLIWTIYRQPADFPTMFVARPFSVNDGAARKECLVAYTLAGVRKLLPPGLTCMDRDEIDDPTIVETWV